MIARDTALPPTSGCHPACPCHLESWSPPIGSWPQFSILRTSLHICVIVTLDLAVALICSSPIKTTVINVYIHRSVDNPPPNCSHPIWAFQSDPIIHVQRFLRPSRIVPRQILIPAKQPVS
ncbi:hypothetical protein K431DRAFT_288453 [Polychaeton citri CBS 116435]|uniref:Uncharacterized protein n=1 Tax=Polychaeton citri CBS 116435 TaxID=1314669 RepID=A0A9P4Q346_9PEZI|nr:hypothetical protein K431DRAFT_288453 [Polychaeton citri CBS 116435]